MESAEEKVRSRREWLGVSALTAIGLGLRLWPVGRLGLTHFDEGIYALVAQWSLMPNGLTGLDASLIPYAPPGYPILGGLAYWLLGRSDGAMIAVSQAAGTATIPVVAWLGRKAFGPGAGFAAATFCAFSGPHVAFSRMALTDASFLLAWLLAIGVGMRFLERPGPVRAIVMGLAVGLAQQFKYNGWIAGGIVILTALLAAFRRPDDRKPGAIARTFGWGILAVGVAWLVVWPWFAFVEANGGYSALLRHQRSYLGGWADWWLNFRVQADQAVALSGGPWLIWPGVIVAFSTHWIARRTWPRPDPTWLIRPSLLVPVILGFGLAPRYLIPAPYWLGIVVTPWILLWPRPTVQLLGVWWLVLAVMTPFYHPYARLWLPYQAVHWIFLGGLVAIGHGVYISAVAWIGSSPPRHTAFRLVIATLLVLFAMGAWVAIPSLRAAQDSRLPGLFDPSDSLYRATVEVARLLPETAKGLRLLARPAVTYYLAGRVPLYPMADSEALAVAGDPDVWALIDSTILVSEPGRNPIERFADRWEVVETIPTTPSLPTVLDLDPDATRSTTDRSYPLWLLRPRTAKATP